MTVPNLAISLVGGALAAVATLVGGTVALRLRRNVALLTAFGSGVVIAVALLELLPEALELSEAAASPFSVMTKVAFGFVGYLVLDRASSLYTQGGSDPSSQLAPALLTAHSAMDGLAVGLALQVSSEAGWLVLLGVLAHDFVDGANSVILSTTEGGSTTRARAWLLANAAAPSAGLVCAAFISISADCIAAAFAVFAGGFLYVGASELLPRSRTDRAPLANCAAIILGFVAFYFFTRV